jgi:hypothetical protein
MAKGEQSVHGYIARAQREGISQNTTMQTLRESGFRFSNQSFRSQWGEVENARAIRGQIADANVNRRPNANEISEISGGKAGQILYRFDFLLRRQGEREVMRQHVGVKTDRFLTFTRAAEIALAKFLANEDMYGSVVVDWIPAAVNEFTGE